LQIKICYFHKDLYYIEAEIVHLIIDLDYLLKTYLFVVQFTSGVSTDGNAGICDGYLCHDTSGQPE